MPLDPLSTSRMDTLRFFREKNGRVSYEEWTEHNNKRTSILLRGLLLDLTEGGYVRDDTLNQEYLLAFQGKEELRKLEHLLQRLGE